MTLPLAAAFADSPPEVLKVVSRYTGAASNAHAQMELAAVRAQLAQAQAVDAVHAERQASELREAAALEALQVERTPTRGKSSKRGLSATVETPPHDAAAVADAEARFAALED